MRKMERIIIFLLIVFMSLFFFSFDFFGSWIHFVKEIEDNGEDSILGRYTIFETTRIFIYNKDDTFTWSIKSSFFTSEDKNETRDDENKFTLEIIMKGKGFITKGEFVIEEIYTVNDIPYDEWKQEMIDSETEIDNIPDTDNKISIKIIDKNTILINDEEYKRQ